MIMIMIMITAGMAGMRTVSSFSLSGHFLFHGLVWLIIRQCVLISSTSSSVVYLEWKSSF